MGAIEVTALHEQHLGQVAELAALRLAELIKRRPALPEHYGRTETLLPMLRDLVARNPGVVALKHGRVVGFLCGMRLTSLWGRRGVYTPEWATASEAPEQITERLYAALARRWVANGYLTHAVTVPEGDSAAAAWQGLGFGPVATDAVRVIEHPSVPSPASVIRRATPADAEIVGNLEDALRRHMAEAPCFLPLVERSDPAEVAGRLNEESRCILLAEERGRVTGFLEIGPASMGACTVIRAEDTASITGAYVMPESRGSGVAVDLLYRALDWARERGAVRCAVDFEPMNPPATHFWSRHFEIVCRSYTRRIDERIGWGRTDRDISDLW